LIRSYLSNADQTSRRTTITLSLKFERTQQ